jgi:uncharacterized repeat protein (TIGR02543 family)
MKMKRFSESGGTLCAALFALALLALTGCSNPGGDEPEPFSLVSIKAETTKAVYIKGQDLDLDTIRITGTYSDGTTTIFPITDAVIDGYDKTTGGNQTVRVTVEGKSGTFAVKVTDDPGEAKEILDTALDTALEYIEGIVVSQNGNGVPEGTKWITSAQKSALDRAIEKAQDLTASEEVNLEELVAALKELQEAATKIQTGTETTWSHTVTFNNNRGTGVNPQTMTVTNPRTTIDSLPEEPVRDDYFFNGWNTAANGYGSAFTETTLVMANITVYAQWTARINAQAPTISAQPRSATYTAGDTAAALSVTAASRDGGELSYRWHSRQNSGDEWTAISGATGSSYTPSTAEAGTLSYYVEVTNTRNDADGTKTASTNSSTVTVRVNPAPIVNAQAPTISAQPQSATYTAGDTATALSVTAASRDGGELSYQWHSREDSGDEWTAISGATESSYTPPTAEAGTLSYYVEVTNTRNDVNGTKTASTNSSTVTVRVNPAPIVNAQAPNISVQPLSATYTRNDTATALSVTAASRDGGELSYRWHSRGSSNDAWTAINGATGTTHTPSTATTGTVYYRVEVTNTRNDVNGTKTAITNSAEAEITVVPIDTQAPVISVQPQNGAYTVGAAATALSVTAAISDGGTLSYQWYSRSGSNSAVLIPNATTTSYTPSTAAAGTVYYYALITNTNAAAEGTKTATTKSREAQVMTGVGAGGLSFAVWTDAGGSLVSDMPANLSISKESQESLVISAADNLTGIQWSINGADLTAPRGTAQSLAIGATNYGIGTYTLGLRAEKDNVPYSINITFSVVN